MVPVDGRRLGYGPGAVDYPHQDRRFGNPGPQAEWRADIEKRIAEATSKRTRSSESSTLERTVER